MKNIIPVKHKPNICPNASCECSGIAARDGSAYSRRGLNSDRIEWVKRNRLRIFSLVVAVLTSTEGTLQESLTSDSRPPPS